MKKNRDRTAKYRPLLRTGGILEDQKEFKKATNFRIKGDCEVFTIRYVSPLCPVLSQRPSGLGLSIHMELLADKLELPFISDFTVELTPDEKIPSMVLAGLPTPESVEHL